MLILCSHVPGFFGVACASAPLTELPWFGLLCHTKLCLHSSATDTGHQRRELEYEDVWAIFGEGRHPHMQRLFETKLAPFLSQSANHFWQSRLWYFKQGLYYQGGMVGPLSCAK